MRLRFPILLSLLLLVFAACQGPPPTMYVLVVTATTAPTADTSTGTAATTPDNTTEPDVSASPVSPTPEPTPTVDPFPTPTVNQVQVAEQRFQNGRMIWLSPTDQIWVLLETEEGRGIWRIYDDTFEEGEVEFDPAIEPPEGLHQPIRGFGKLWRENLEVRDALGWALEPEYGHVTRYEYKPGGHVNEQNEYEPGPGKHYVISLYGETLIFDEATFTWEIGE